MIATNVPLKEIESTVTASIGPEDIARVSVKLTRRYFQMRGMEKLQLEKRWLAGLLKYPFVCCCLLRYRYLRQRWSKRISDIKMLPVTILHIQRVTTGFHICQFRRDDYSISRTCYSDPRYKVRSISRHN